MLLSTLKSLVHDWPEHESKATPRQDPTPGMQGGPFRPGALIVGKELSTCSNLVVTGMDKGAPEVYT